MRTSLAHRCRSAVSIRRSHLGLVTLLVVIFSACGGSGGSGGVAANMTLVGSGNATLSWMPPTLNTDGSPLTDLAGYRIYYGNQPGNYHSSILVDNPGLTIYVVENLRPNTYYFVMTAINSRGVESDFSNEASRQVL